MSQPVFSIVDGAKAELRNEFRRMIDDLKKRIERLEKVVEHICPDKSSDYESMEAYQHFLWFLNAKYELED